MKTVLWIFPGLVIVFAFISFLWRMTSLRLSLPCPVWLRWLVELDNPFTETNRASFIIQHLDLQPGMKALDFGCGPGRLTIPMAEKVGTEGQVTAVDIQPGMLARTQEKAQAQNRDNIQFVQAAAGEGKLGTDQFDRAVLVTVLGEIPDQSAAMKELFNAMKPGGLLSVTEVIFDPHFQGRETVLKLAQEVGFQNKNFFGNNLTYTLHLAKPNPA
jgi:ubiquinone/menaquinone biosynthesis C-methylase UbiE